MARRHESIFSRSDYGGYYPLQSNIQAMKTETPQAGQNPYQSSQTWQTTYEMNFGKTARPRCANDLHKNRDTQQTRNAFDNRESEGMLTFATNAKQHDAAALRRKNDAIAIAKCHQEQQKKLADLKNEIMSQEKEKRLREERIIGRQGLRPQGRHMCNEQSRRMDLYEMSKKMSEEAAKKTYALNKIQKDSEEQVSRYMQWQKDMHKRKAEVGILERKILEGQILHKQMKNKTGSYSRIHGVPNIIEADRLHRHLSYELHQQETRGPLWPIPPTSGDRPNNRSISNCRLPPINIRQTPKTVQEQVFSATTLKKNTSWY